MAKKIKVSFAPGCFDNFDGTQEELDELITEIKKTFENLKPEDIDNHPNIRSMDFTDPLLSQPKHTRH